MKETLFSQTRAHVLRKMRRLSALGKTKLPTEREFAGEVEASYATVRLVMAELEKEGYVRRVRGSGTYLQPQAQELLKKTLLIVTSPLTGGVDCCFAAYFVRELEAAAAQHHCSFIECQVRDHDGFLNILNSSREKADAVVYLPPVINFTTRQLGELSKFNTFPLIFVDVDLESIDVNNVTTNNYLGGMLAARSLLQYGRRNLLILQTEPQSRQVIQRLLGFRELVTLFGLSPDFIDCRVGLEDDRTGKTYDCLNHLLRQGISCDGVFCLSDSGAVGAYEAIRANGIRPGEEIALLGFDGMPLQRTDDFSLASVAQPVREIAKEVITLIEKWTPGQFAHRYLSPSLLKGSSLGKIQYDASEKNNRRALVLES